MSLPAIQHTPLNLHYGDLPTVTPPAHGEPTVPAEALAMRAAPTATPSPIPPSPTSTLSPTPTFTPAPATGSDDVEMIEVPAGEFLMGSTYQQIVEYFGTEPGLLSCDFW
jgi:formylglycine-generating enzyme required for sulfatase activity